MPMMMRMPWCEWQCCDHFEITGSFKTSNNLVIYSAANSQAAPTQLTIEKIYRTCCMTYSWSMVSHKVNTTTRSIWITCNIFFHIHFKYLVNNNRFFNGVNKCNSIYLSSLKLIVLEKRSFRKGSRETKRYHWLQIYEEHHHYRNRINILW
jgi:hypothetical protein